MTCSSRRCAKRYRSVLRKLTRPRPSGSARSTTTPVGAGCRPSRRSARSAPAQSRLRRPSSLRSARAPLPLAGWSATPTPPASGQLASAAQQCSANLGTPALTDTRGPYTASIYADDTSSHLCLQGGSLSIASTSSGPAEGDVPAGQIQLFGSGIENSSGQALTLVDGRVGAGVTSVTIDRSDGVSVQATVSGGWYLAWWPGTAHATTAELTTTTGTATQQFPSTQQGPGAPRCPAGGNCSSGYSFGSGSGSSVGGGSNGNAQMAVGGSRSQ